MKNSAAKVLQIFNQYLEYGGEEGSVGRIAELLRRKAYVVTYRGSTNEVLDRPGGKFLMPFLMQKNRKVLADLRKIQAKEDFDVWQIHNVFPGLSVAVYELAAELGVPVIQYLHNYRFGCANATYFRDGKACVDCQPDSFMPAIIHRCWRGSLPATVSMVAALKRFWRAGGIENIKAFIALSEAQKKAHVSMGIPEERIHVVHHYLDDDGQQNAVPPIDGDVLFIGRLTEEKGVDLLIRSWAKVDASGRKLRIVGKGVRLEALQKLVLEENIEDVIFEGFVPKEKHPALWSKASFFVASSVWNEPFGMVILESWLQNRPVLATNLGSFPDLISDRVDGWLADPNIDSFSHTLQMALNATESYEQMGIAGRNKLQVDFAAEKWLSKWSEVLGGVLKS
jgi:glycosyltransferase involved in cell wall biosynthesis